MERALGVPDDNHSEMKAAPAVKQYVATSFNSSEWQEGNECVDMDK